MRPMQRGRSILQLWWNTPRANGSLMVAVQLSDALLTQSRLCRPQGTYSHRLDRDWLFFDIDHDAYHAHHTRAEAVDTMPAVVGVSRRGSVVRVNADGSSVDHDVESAVWHATLTTLPVGGSRASEGALAWR